jgi:hypothetical protein
MKRLLHVFLGAEDEPAFYDNAIFGYAHPVVHVHSTVHQVTVVVQGLKAYRLTCQLCACAETWFGRKSL